MRKVSVIVLVLCALMMVPATHASTIKLYQNAYSYGVGGEFTAILSSDISAGILANYNASATLYNSTAKATGFETFCLEYDEYFSTNTTYNVSIGNQALNGGVNTNGGDPISIGTAYLYSQFAQGTLSGYFTGNRQVQAGLLQQTFWWLEGEGVSYNTNNAYMKMVLDMFGSQAAAMANANGAYGVAVLNIADANNGLHQDQLVFTGLPVPEPASLLLLGFGLLGLAGIGRKSRK